MAIKLYMYDKDNIVMFDETVKWCWIPEEEDGTVFLQNNQSIDKNILIVLETESGLKLLVKEEN